MTIRVDVQVVTTYKPLPSKKQLSAWAAHALAHLPGKQELTIRVVDEAESQALNHTYRGKDYATNVLSFPYQAPPGVTLPYLGDLVICGPLVKRESESQHKALEAHWAHLVIHGCLHLIGFDHIDESDAMEMETRERDLLHQLGFPDPYAEDA